MEGETHWRAVSRASCDPAKFWPDLSLWKQGGRWGEHNLYKRQGLGVGSQWWRWWEVTGVWREERMCRRELYQGWAPILAWTTGKRTVLQVLGDEEFCFLKVFERIILLSFTKKFFHVWFFEEKAHICIIHIILFKTISPPWPHLILKAVSWRGCHCAPLGRWELEQRSGHWADRE